MNKNVLITTSILTSFWDEKKNNLELIKPFVLVAINKTYVKNDEIKLSTISELMKEQFGFKNLPLLVLKHVFDRLCREGAMKKDHERYYLVEENKQCVENFESKEANAKQDIKFAVSEVKKYIENSDNKKITYEKAAEYLTDFMSGYGYIAFGDISDTRKINEGEEHINYLIGELIYNESKNETALFNKTLSIMKGHMLANAIYIQIDNDNASNLQKLTCYLDSPIVLKVLGLKTKEENQTAKEMMAMLKKEGAKVKCFSHTFDEIRGIIEYYKYNKHSNLESTLEYFDDNNYGVPEIENYIYSLYDTLNKHGIEIDDDDHMNKKSVDEEKYKELYSRIYKDKEKRNIKLNNNSIENDVNSIKYINALRENRRVQRIENSEAILITTHKCLNKSSNEIFCKNNEIYIGPTIDELDMTTILWLKDAKNNDFPKLHLIEKSVSAINISDAMVERIKEVAKKLNSSNAEYSKNIDLIITKRNLNGTNLNNKFKNDLNAVSEEELSKYFVNKDDRISELLKEKDKYESKINIKEKNILNSYNSKVKKAEEGIKKKYKKINNSIRMTLITVFAILTSWLIVNMFINQDFTNITMYIFTAISAIGLIESIFKINGKIDSWINRKLDNFKRNELREKLNSIDEEYKEMLQ